MIIDASFNGVYHNFTSVKSVSVPSLASRLPFDVLQGEFLARALGNLRREAANPLTIIKRLASLITQ